MLNNKSRSASVRALGLCVSSVLLGHATLSCGAKTGLLDNRGVIPRRSTPPLPPVCGMLRVRVPVGVVAALDARVEATVVPAEGYRWTLLRKPLASVAMAPGAATRSVNFTADIPGEYQFSVTTPLLAEGGAPLGCAVIVEGLNVDPNCPGSALPEPSIVQLTQSSAQLALDPAFSNARSQVVASVALHVAEIPTEDVAIAVLEQQAPMSVDALAIDLENRLIAGTGATAILQGLQGTTTDGFRFRRSVFRAPAAASTFAWVARNRALREWTDVEPGSSRGGTITANSFVFETTTVAVPGANRAVSFLAVAPESLVNDPTKPAGFRLMDVTQATGLARSSRTVGLRCQALVATRNTIADFLWLVDTSGSMVDEQERLGNTAQRFFTEMNNAGIDFRVGVIQAGSLGPVDLNDPGFAWISGTDASGPQKLAFQVTSERYQDNAMDRAFPYPLAGQAEEPVAAAVLVATEMERRAMTDPDDSRRFRQDATRVAFFVTDEDGLNDDARFFALDQARWGAQPEDRITNVARWFRDHHFLTFGLLDFFGAVRCPDRRNFGPCVVAANGGAYIPLSTALDAEVSAGLSRVVDAVAAESSEFVLDGAPIASTLRVRVEMAEVPRSRADGFDFGAGRRTIVFRGPRYRPRMGQTVRVAHYFWQ